MQRAPLQAMKKASCLVRIFFFHQILRLCDSNANKPAPASEKPRGMMLTCAADSSSRLRLHPFAALFQVLLGWASNFGDTTSATTRSWRARKDNCMASMAAPNAPARESSGWGCVHYSREQSTLMAQCSVNRGRTSAGPP
eukprot:1157778-Pelagomonas_calceolata.AAC.7